VTLDEAREHVREKVVYSTHPGEMLAGVIWSVNDRYVFVEYARGRPIQATYPENLTLMRGDSLAEHIRLGMTEAGFGLAGDEYW
jgi:hypothetical protein